MDPTVYQLKISMRAVRPLVWRRLLLPSAFSLAKVHRVLQGALGWTNSHLHQFLVGNECYGMPDVDEEWSIKTIDERRVRLEQVANAGSTFVYEYDFGDSWEHDVVVEDVAPLTPLNSIPICLDGRRACPPEDCGGPHGYADLVKVLSDLRHREHDEMKAWAPPGFSPDHVDIRRINDELRALATRWRPLATRSKRAMLVTAVKPANDE